MDSSVIDGLFVTGAGILLVVVARINRAEVAKAKVPGPVIIGLDRPPLLEEWKQEANRLNRGMTWAGSIAVIVGVGLIATDLVRAAWF